MYNIYLKIVSLPPISRKEAFNSFHRRAFMRTSSPWRLDKYDPHYFAVLKISSSLINASKRERTLPWWTWRRRGIYLRSVQLPTLSVFNFHGFPIPMRAYSCLQPLITIILYFTLLKKESSTLAVIWPPPPLPARTLLLLFLSRSRSSSTVLF